MVGDSVTREGDLLDFGQLFKAFAKINLPKSSLFLGNFCKGVKIYHFSSGIIFWNHFWVTFIDIWRFFSGHTDCLLIAPTSTSDLLGEAGLNLVFGPVTSCCSGCG